MEKRFGDKVTVTGESIPGTSGVFEVSIKESGKMLHSKKGGDGYVDTDAKLEKICAGVQEAIGA